MTYGEYLGRLDRMPKGLNVGGMVGHCALRQYAMGDRRGIERRRPPPTTSRRCARLLEEAMRGRRARASSTSRTLLHTVPDGRPVPGTYAEPDELLAFADVLGRHGARRVRERHAPRRARRDDADFPNTRAEMA